MFEDNYLWKSVYDEIIMWICKKIYLYIDIYVIIKICVGIGCSFW